MAYMNWWTMIKNKSLRGKTEYMFNDIVIFTSDLFDLSWHDTEDELNKNPLGQDVAEFLRDRLKKRGLEVSEVIEDTGGWVIDITMQRNKYTAYIHWAPLGEKGEKPQDYWVVQPRKLKGFLQNLFAKSKSANDELEPICKVIQRILTEEPRISNIKCISQSEFRQLY